MSKNKKIAVIGDIHGCCTNLQKLYEKVLARTDEVYSVGDLVDRGSHSKEVVQFCIDNGISPVMGNHEEMLLEAIENFEGKKGQGPEFGPSSWLHNGGSKTISSYTGNRFSKLADFVEAFKQSGHAGFISGLPLQIELDECIITHGGIVTGQTPESCLWNRDEPSVLEKFQVFGHTPNRKAVHKHSHYINIDTGCVFWGTLSAAVISSGEVEILSA